MKPKVESQKEAYDQDLNHGLGRISHRMKEEHGKKVMGRGLEKTKLDREAWLLHNPYKVEKSKVQQQ
jgi:hypothetical protein